MITRMEIDRPQPSVPDLSLGGFMPSNDPVVVRNIDGLGPVKSDISKTPFATGRGELFQGASTGTRNIVLTLGFNPNWVDQTMSSLRQLLYRYFMAGTWATLRFFSDELPEVYIRGIVESFEPNLFSEDPEIQISILCPKPDFIDAVTTLVSGVIGVPVIIDYIGTAPSGFTLRIISSSYGGDLNVNNQLPDGTLQHMGLSGISITASAYLEINTLRSQRYVYSVPSGTVVTNILANLAADSDWPELIPGKNTFTVNAGTTGPTWTMGYFNRFGGL